MRDRTLYRVMLVEPNPEDVRVVREALAEHPFFSFQVAHFQQVEEALKFLLREKVDVALLDYQLPGTDGLESLSRIIAAAPNLPVVMLTGVEDDATGMQMVQRGAQDYLVKGAANAAMLVRTIRQAIERKRMSDLVRDSEERFALTTAGAGDGIWDWQIPNDHLFLSPRAKIILGFPDGLPDENMDAFYSRIHLDDVVRFRDAMAAHLKGETADFRQQARVMGPDDQSRWVFVRGLAVVDDAGKARRMAGSISDLSNLDAYYDSVTGLPNRALLIDHLRSTLKLQIDHVDRCSALLVVSLTRYSEINQTLGHAAGDALVTGAARAIEGAARIGDVIGRINTREIGVILKGIGDPEQAIVIAARICHALQEPIKIEGQNIVPAMRMGILVMTSAYSDPEAAMRDATTALNEEKADYDLPFCVFNPEMQERVSARLRIEVALQRAIERDAFQLLYQPIVALEDGKLRGFEALLRLHDAELGDIPPMAFIPVAEEIGLIKQIGSWVLHTACRQIAEWRNDGLTSDGSEFSVSVNLSGRQLDTEESIGHIMAVIAATGVPPANLTLELTESALLANPDRAHDALTAIKQHGVSLAMDDFGTGYSSLSYLGRFPFDKLKIDRSFVNTIADGVASPLLKGMLGLCRELGLHVVAEGVETEEQRDVLAKLGCQDAQGWLFGKAMDADHATSLLRAAGSDGAKDDTARKAAQSQRPALSQSPASGIAI